MNLLSLFVIQKKGSREMNIYYVVDEKTARVVCKRALNLALEEIGMIPEWLDRIYKYFSELE